MRLFKVCHTTTSILMPNIATDGVSIVRALDSEHAKDVCMRECHSYDQNFIMTEVEEVNMAKMGVVYTWVVN